MGQEEMAKIAEAVNILGNFCGSRDIDKLTTAALEDKYHIPRAGKFLLTLVRRSFSMSTSKRSMVWRHHAGAGLVVNYAAYKVKVTGNEKGLAYEGVPAGIPLSSKVLWGTQGQSGLC